ncbi:hypothetical protein K1T35_48475 (plasmid) [Pseudonocardia sp. DSM 110487]|uniref:hypothetical protein n=1 Tax=Pseudonocardia sp. DSM 110487 TaxID=2865833 RepID=UPI001C6A7999|nr:hypothetical protein [Pseudonocardia sp. DSM 110487]QYN41184.1 hypothetical protein K1T35_48475 [Pseudonocardia sp. DSM 110487]
MSVFTAGQQVEWRSGRVVESGKYLGPDEWQEWARVDTADGEHLVRARVLRAEGVLAAEDAALADLIERAKGYPIGDDEHAARSRQHGFPWCDTCKRPSVGSEWLGLVHSTVEHPSGVPKHLDESGHEVTHHEWYRVPR